MPVNQRVPLAKKKPTPQKLWDSMKEDYQNKLNHIMRSHHGNDKYSTDELVDYISKNERAITRFIETKSNNKTKRSYYNAVNVFYRLNSQKRQSDYITLMVKELGEEIMDEYDSNVMNENRAGNFVTFDEIVQKREHYKDLFEKDPSDNKTNITYLLLSLYTYIPPLRVNFVNMEFAKGAKPREKDNFMWYNGRQKKYHIILNSDKVSKSYAHQGTYDYTIEVPELNQIIKDSLKAYPRPFVLSNLKNPDSALMYNEMRRHFHDAFRSEGKKVGVDIIRSAYITHHHTVNPAMKHKKKLAKEMRHSVAVAQSAYFKVGVNPPQAIQQAAVNPLPPQPVPVKKVSPPFDLKAWTKTYREKAGVKDKMKESQHVYYEKNKLILLRKKKINDLNNGNIEHPTQRSIDKFKLKFEDGQWV